MAVRSHPQKQSPALRADYSTCTQNFILIDNEAIEQGSVAIEMVVQEITRVAKVWIKLPIGRIACQ
ncbi:hypothetical protein D3C75_1252800 [compost metagenome]